MDAITTRFTKHPLYGTNKIWIYNDNHRNIFILTFSESRCGVISRVNFSQPQRDSHLPVPVDLVDDWYAALKRFHDLAIDGENLVEFKLEPGNP